LFLKKLVEFYAQFKIKHSMRNYESRKRHNELLYKMIPIIIKEGEELKETWSQIMEKIDAILDKINENRRLNGEIS
jgi:hypothetical protein